MNINSKRIQDVDTDTNSNIFVDLSSLMVVIIVVLVVLVMKDSYFQVTPTPGIIDFKALVKVSIRPVDSNFQDYYKEVTAGSNTYHVKNWNTISSVNKYACVVDNESILIGENVSNAKTTFTGSANHINFKKNDLKDFSTIESSFDMDNLESGFSSWKTGILKFKNDKSNYIEITNFKFEVLGKTNHQERFSKADVDGKIALRPSHINNTEISFKLNKGVKIQYLLDKEKVLDDIVGEFLHYSPFALINCRYHYGPNDPKPSEIGFKIIQGMKSVEIMNLILSDESNEKEKVWYYKEIVDKNLIKLKSYIRDNTKKIQLTSESTNTLAKAPTFFNEVLVDVDQ